jgi:hypothetical protein
LVRLSIFPVTLATVTATKPTLTMAVLRPVADQTQNCFY